MQRNKADTVLLTLQYHDASIFLEIGDAENHMCLA